MTAHTPTPFKFKTETLGHHVHVTVFVANSGGNTYQNAGRIVLDDWQWKLFERGFNTNAALLEAAKYALVKFSLGLTRQDMMAAEDRLRETIAQAEKVGS